MLGIRANCADLNELGQTNPSCMFDQMQSHGHVGIEVAAWIVPIRPDSTHFCGQVDDHIGLCRGVQPLNRRFCCQIKFRASRHDDFSGTTLGHLVADKAAHESGPPCDHHTFVLQIKRHRLCIGMPAGLVLSEPKKSISADERNSQNFVAKSGPNLVDGRCYEPPRSPRKTLQ